MFAGFILRCFHLLVLVLCWEGGEHFWVERLDNGPSALATDAGGERDPGFLLFIPFQTMGKGHHLLLAST